MVFKYLKNDVCTDGKEKNLICKHSGNVLNLKKQANKTSQSCLTFFLLDSKDFKNVSESVTN